MRAREALEILFKNIAKFTRAEIQECDTGNETICRMLFLEKQEAIVSFAKYKFEMGIRTSLRIWCYHFPEGCDTEGFCKVINTAAPSLEITAGPFSTDIIDTSDFKRGQLVVEDILVECCAIAFLKDEFLEFLLRVLAAAKMIQHYNKPPRCTYWSAYHSAGRPKT